MARFLRARSGMAGFIKAFRRLHARSLEKKWESWAKSYEAMGPVEQAAAWNAVGRKQRRYLERQLGMRRPLRTETQAALDAIVEIFTLLKEEWPRLTDKLGNAPATRGLWSTLDQNRRKAFKQELCLATVASNAMALRNLFPSDQAERLIAKYTAALAKAMELDVSYVEQVFRNTRGDRIDNEILQLPPHPMLPFLFSAPVRSCVNELGGELGTPLQSTRRKRRSWLPASAPNAPCCWLKPS